MKRKHRQSQRSVIARQFWQRHLDVWRGSCLKQIDYCRQHGLRLKGFILWKSKLAPDGESEIHQSTQRLIPVVLKKDRRDTAGAGTRQPDPTHLDIRLPNGVQLVLTISDHFALPAVLRELAGLKC